MAYDFDSIVPRDGTNSVKWEFMHDVNPAIQNGTIPFWVADMDFPCAPAILKALHKRVDRAIFGYSSLETPDYYRAVCGWYRRRFDWFVKAEDLVYSPGVVPAIGFLIDILSEKGDGVIIQPPVYYPFARVIGSHGRTIVNNPLINEGGRYRMDLQDLRRAVSDPSAKVLILCSPHNPVGRVWTREELEALAFIFQETKINVISDEIHYDLTRRGVVHTPLAKIFPQYKDRIITATAPSKTFNLAGMQLANIVIHDAELRKRWNQYVGRTLSLQEPTALAITAAQAAYEEGEAWLEELRDYLDGNITFLQEFLKTELPLSRCVPPEGTYLAWIDLSAYDPKMKDLVDALAKEAGILIEEGTLFGEEGEGYVRVNLACPLSLLKEGMERMARYLKGRS